MKTKNKLKGFLIILLSAGLALGASAQRGVHYSGGGSISHGGGFGGGHVVYSYPRTYVGLGLGFGYGYPWGYYGAYGPYGPYGYYPGWYYGHGAMPSPLAQQVSDIKNDFSDQIKEVKHDKSLTRQERRAKVDQLKKDRDNAVVQARKDYFDTHYNRNRQPGTYKGDDQPQQQQQQQNGNNPKPEGSTSEQPEYQSGN